MKVETKVIPEQKIFTYIASDNTKWQSAESCSKHEDEIKLKAESTFKLSVKNPPLPNDDVAESKLFKVNTLEDLKYLPYAHIFYGRYKEENNKKFVTENIGKWLVYKRYDGGDSYDSYYFYTLDDIIKELVSQMTELENQIATLVNLRNKS